MTPVDSAAAAPPSYRWARVSLLLIAATELLDALSSVQDIFTEYHSVATLCARTQQHQARAVAPARWRGVVFSRHEGIYATRFLP